MRSNYVLVDVGLALERDDLEAISHVDRARHDVVASAFDKKGPLRAVTKASITPGGITCSSFEDKRLLNSADAELVPYLRQTTQSTQSLLDVKEYFVIDSLALSNNAFDLIDGALECTTLSWQDYGYAKDRNDVEQDYGNDFKDYDEKDIKEHEERYRFLEAFFSQRTVRNAEILLLVELPYVHGKAVSSWLQGDNAVSHLCGARELHIWWEGYEGSEINALVSVLEQRFLDDSESREYKFVAKGQITSPCRIQTRKLQNGAGDVFEVEVMLTCASSVTLTRYRQENAKRTALVQSMDGPKVWDFRTARELEKYLLGHNVFELLARSGLVANEMICKCCSRMYLQNMWRCSGNCENGYHETFHISPTFGSWFWDDGKHLYGCVATLLRLVILLASDGIDVDGAAKLDDVVPWYRHKLLEVHGELLK